MRRLETKIPPVLIAAASVVLGWAVGQLDLDGTPLANSAGALAGLVLAVSGVMIAASGIRQFARAGTTANPYSIDRASNLVTTGIYRFTRNPMYVGMALAVAGVSLQFGTIVGMVVAVAFYVGVLTRLQIQPEERVLGSKFGVVYGQYCEQTRRWI